jgi:carbon-monoxide dehydrogenase medium subunit
MRQMDMLFPATLAEAAAALGKRGAIPLAGATDIIPAIRQGNIAPTTLVNLKSIPDLAGVRRVRGGIRIGAVTKIGDLLLDNFILTELPLMAEVARGFGSVQMRNLATIGGNICNAAPSADMALPLLVLDARLAVYSKDRTREIDIADFFLGMGKTAIRRGEILASITIPKPRGRTGAAHAKLGIRQAMDLAFVAVAGALQLSPDGRKCRSARIALGAVAPTPMRARKAEAILEGQPITDDLIAKAAAAAAAESRPITDLRASKEYRHEMVEVLTRRVLHEAVRRARLVLRSGAASLLRRVAKEDR